MQIEDSGAAAAAHQKASALKPKFLSRPGQWAPIPKPNSFPDTILSLACEAVREVPGVELDASLSLAADLWGKEAQP